MKQEIKDESDDGFVAVNTTQSSCDYSMSQFKDDPLSELPPDEESEEDVPLVFFHLFTDNLIPLPRCNIAYIYIDGPHNTISTSSAFCPVGRY